MVSRRFQAVPGGSRGLQGPPGAGASRGPEISCGGGGVGQGCCKGIEGVFKGSERPDPGCLGEFCIIPT